MDDPRFQVSYDPAKNEFVGGSGPSAIPAHVLFDGAALLSWFRERPDVADGFEGASGAANALRDLKIPAYVDDGTTSLRTVPEDVQARTGFGRLGDSSIMQLILSRRGPDVTWEIRNAPRRAAIGATIGRRRLTLGAGGS